MYPGTSQAISSATIIIREEINFILMNEAVNVVIKNNDALRIRLVKQNNTPQQYFADFVKKKFDILDFSYEDGENDYKKWEKEKTGIPFTVIESELFDFVMIKLGERKNICYFKFHHMITDAWGFVLVIRRTMKEYWQLIHGLCPGNEEPSFIDHINDELDYLASERFEKHKEFWSDVFDTVPDFISFSENKGFSSLAGKRKSYVLSQSLNSKLKGFCESNKVSAFSVFYALLALYLSKRSNKRDIAIETPILNRTGKKEKNTAGMFMHNIPTRIYVDPNLNFLSFAKESFSELKKFMRNQRYPYSSLLKDFREKHQYSGMIVDVTLNYWNVKRDSMIEYEGIWNYPGAQPNSLSIGVSDWADDGLPVLDYDYLLEVFCEEDIDQMHQNMCNLLQDSLDNPNKRLSELRMFSPDELNKLLIGFNQTELPYEAKTVSEMFEDQVIKTPNRTAIVFGDKRLNYNELNEKANQLARYICSKGMIRNSIVGLMVNRSLEMVIGILGILKAGAAYLPIDPGYPSERIAYMLNQSHTRLTLTDKDYLGIDKYINCKFANILLSNQTIYVNETANLDIDNEPNLDDLAYVIFTSGSTGKPKGVMVHHHALCNFINGIADTINLENKTIVSLTTISFDIFFLETILPLTKGMKVIIANEDEQTIPKLFFNLVDLHQIEVVQTTPSKIKLILSEEQGIECLKSISHILIGGEGFPGPLLPRLKKITQAEIYNMYGPTETTVWSTIKNLTHSKKTTIGRPIANTQIYILDEHLFPVTIGSVGEIFIAGDGVSLGYLHNPELTREYFLENPFKPGKLMYRTGDLGRWLKNGEIECLGRNDNQVKIRGLRIEIEEIEACLLEHSAIKEVMVAVREDKAGKKQLVAYLTSETRPSNEELRSHILKSLPNYMVPNWFTWVNTIPLTPNGKIDRRALLEHSVIDFGQSTHTYSTPRNDLEWKLARLWADALEVEQVGIDDNLFALGGDSLTILEIMAGSLAYEWKLTAQNFYEYPTVRQLSSKISSLTKENEGDEEIYVPKRVRPKEIIIKPLDIGNVLLTGATGFLGIHLLMELLLKTENNIYCLVRGNQAKVRLEELLEFYFPLLPEQLKNRIILVNGDICLKKFGLVDMEYQNLAQKVQTVIHSAALVKHYGNYSEFETNNVQGTSEVIDFCISFDKKLNHISTISISGDFVVDPSKVNTVFTEEDFYIGQDYKTNVYVRSKFAAENEVLKAVSNRLRASIFRVGVLTGRYEDGKFQHNIEQNAFYRRIKSMVSLSIIPVSFLDQSIEFTPVDYCAKGIVNIIKVNQTNDGLVFHMFNHLKLKGIELLSFLRSLDISVRTLPNMEFDSFIAQLSQSKEGKEMLSGLVSDLSVNKRLYNSNAITPDSTFTINYLNQTGFDWPEIDAEYLDKVFSDMLKVGFINKSISYSA